MLIPDLERDLVEAAGRLPRRSRRAVRPLVVLAAATAVAGVIALLLFDGVGGEHASAPSGAGPPSVGVTAVDALISIEGGPGRQPGPGGAAEALDTPGMTRLAKTVVYASQSGLICSVTAELHPSGEGVRGSYPSCHGLDGLLAALERRPLQTGGWVESPSERVYTGYAAGDVTAIRGVGGGGVMVRLSPPWTPKLDGARPLRHFVLVDATDLEAGDDPPPPPPVEITFEDGRRVRAELF